MSEFLYFSITLENARAKDMRYVNTNTCVSENGLSNFYAKYQFFIITSIGRLNAFIYKTSQPNVRSDQHTINKH